MNILEIAKVIRSKRKEKGWTQEKLAERSGLTRQTVSEFENGNLDEIGFAKLGRMCLALKLEILVKPLKADRSKMLERARSIRDREMDEADREIEEAVRKRRGVQL